MSRTQPFAPHNAPPFVPFVPIVVANVVNPVSVGGTKVYVRCVDGKMRGRHVWIEKDSYSFQFQSAPPLKGHYHLSDMVLTVKCHVYYVKKHEFRRGDVRTVIYYLGIKNGDPFDDLTHVFGPKTG